MERELNEELTQLIVGTDDLRRRVGQVFYYFYRSLIFWTEKGLSFYEVTKLWAAGAAAMLDTMAGTLSGLHPHERDERLRTYVADVLRRLCAYVGQDERMHVTFVRWMEPRFAELTEMMKEDSGVVRIYDYDLALSLSQALAAFARAGRDVAAGELESVARELTEPE